jgi:hypothetical protein
MDALIPLILLLEAGEHILPLFEGGEHILSLRQQDNWLRWQGLLVFPVESLVLLGWHGTTIGLF